MRSSAALSIALAAALLAGCRSNAPAAGVEGGDPQRGMAAIVRFGCGTCHTVAGIRVARGLVGPPLTGLRDRSYIAGMLANTPDNLVHWIREPKDVNPKTAMPALGISAQDAADIAAYIYSIP